MWEQSLQRDSFNLMDYLINVFPGIHYCLASSSKCIVAWKCIVQTFIPTSSVSGFLRLRAYNLKLWDESKVVRDNNRSNKNPAAWDHHQPRSRLLDTIYAILPSPQLVTSIPRQQPSADRHSTHVVVYKIIVLKFICFSDLFLTEYI